MPSAEQFATEFPSFWRAALPMAEGFMRTANLGHLRYTVPMETTTPNERQAIVAEAAFAEFRLAQGQPEGRQVSDEAVRAARVHLAAIVNEPVASIDALSTVERREASELAERIAAFVSQVPSRNLVVDPVLPGCGIIDESRGDLLLDAMLVEIKAVGRTFRIHHLRQILTYAALAHAAQSIPIRALVLLNPRHGTYLSWDPDSLCLQIAGTPASEVFEGIIRYVSDFEPHSP